MRLHHSGNGSGWNFRRSGLKITTNQAYWSTRLLANGTPPKPRVPSIIQHIRDYCEEIRKTIERYGEGFAVFDQDADYQRSIAFSILQIGELSGGLSEEYRKATSSRVQWGPMKGMRNLVAHSYGSMNREIIWETAVNDIPTLKQFCEEQLAEN